MYQRIIRFTDVVLVTALALCAAAPAFAQLPSGSTNGTICEINSDPTAWNSTQLSYTSFGEVLNDDPTRGLAVVCSLPRDHIETPRTDTVVYAIIHKSVADAYTACTLMSRGGFFQTQVATPGTGEQLLVFQGLHSYGHQDLRLFCLFPEKVPGKKSGLQSIMYLDTP